MRWCFLDPKPNPVSRDRIKMRTFFSKSPDSGCSKLESWRFPAVCLATLLAVCLFIKPHLTAQESPRLGQNTDSTLAKIRREGARVDQLPVNFRTENELLLLILAEDGKPIRVLENLAAQRIYRANREDPEDSHWSVTGTFTEFEGKNFFLIERAVRQFQKERK